ncbi:MAG: hypothetical protein O2802_02950, partial [Proteobacteria bacterium]|nr:hypothetical protein [Pseudomonadota bacterium]
MRYLDTVKQRFSALLPMWLLIMLVAIWSVVIQDGHINRDGLLYLKQAYLMAEGSWKEGLALYPWPFFSILIAIFHKASGLHLQVVAHSVDLMLFGIAAWFYLKTLKLIYKQKHIIFYGGIILFSFIPIMDDYVGMVLRDHGLWAGCMMGTYFYFVYLKENTFKNNLLWQLSFAFAGLFRPEAFIFLVLIPILHVFLFSKQQSKWLNIKQLIQHYGVVLGYTLYLLINKVFLSSGELVSDQGSRLSEFIPRLLSFFKQITSPLPITSSHPYLTDLLTNYPLTITVGLLLAILIVKWLKGIGLLIGGLLLYGFNRRLQKDLDGTIKLSLYFFIGISFVLVAMNLFNVYVLSNRYWVYHWFWLFIFVTPFLAEFFESKDSSIMTYLKPLVIIFIVVSIISALIDSQKSNIEEEAAQYFKNLGSINSVKLIGAERAGYYSGLTMKELMEARNPELHDT